MIIKSEMEGTFFFFFFFSAQNISSCNLQNIFYIPERACKVLQVYMSRISMPTHGAPFFINGHRQGISAENLGRKS